MKVLFNPNRWALPISFEWDIYDCHIYWEFRFLCFTLTNIW